MSLCDLDSYRERNGRSPTVHGLPRTLFRALLLIVWTLSVCLAFSLVIVLYTILLPSFLYSPLRLLFQPTTYTLECLITMHCYLLRITIARLFLLNYLFIHCALITVHWEKKGRVSHFLFSLLFTLPIIV